MTRTSRGSHAAGDITAAGLAAVERGVPRRKLSTSLGIRFHQPGGSMAMQTEFAETADHTEGRIARSIEDQTARLPSDFFLWLAVGSMTVSAALQLTGNRHGSLFVGQWAPAFLLFGVYNKLVKQSGSDWTSPEASH
jgi:hypothetical protein